MYASNEDEFDREHADWVFLHQSAPASTALHGAMNILDHEPVVVSSSSDSSSRSDSDSASPLSNHSESLSSGSSDEDERAQHEDLSVTAASPSSADDPVLPSQVEEEVKEHGVSSEISMQSIHHGETSPVINEYELPNGACDSKTESVMPSTPVRRRITEQSTPTVEHERRFVRPPLPPRRSEAKSPLIVYLVLAILVALPLILCRFATSQRLVLDRMTENLQKTNQRLDQIKSISVEDLEQKLTKQLEAKFHELLQQKLAEHEREKYSLVLQINELYHSIHVAQQNFSNAIEQLSMENEQLHVQLRALEERPQSGDQQHSKADQKYPDETDFNTSSSAPLDILISNVVKQASSIAENTTLNVAGFFEQLSASLSDIVDNRHEIVEESKRKLNDLAGSKAAEQVHATICRSVESLSSSLHKAHSTYATWVRSRAQQREQARMDSAEHEKQGQSPRRPWRWTFQRGQERQQMRQHDTPTKRHWTHKEHVCHSAYEFPVNQLCTMKNWMERFFRP